MTLFDPASPAASTCKLLVAYDGTDFHGFAAQQGQRTIAGELHTAIGKVTGDDVDLTCAGRTDAGVHAWGQVVSFPTTADLDCERIRKSLNAMLAPAIVVRDAALAPPGFNARFDAHWRHYRYTIVNRPVPDPFRARHSWWVDKPLDVNALRLAADVFMGEHDFASFCRQREGSTTTRCVSESEWFDDGEGLLRYEIRANAFCWQMVRSIVGTLVEAGYGKRKPGTMLAILHANDRAAAGNMAPARGLCLWEVGY